MPTSQLPTEPGQFEPDQQYPRDQRDGYQQQPPSYSPQQETEYPQYPPQFPPQQQWQQPPMQPMQPHQPPKKHRIGRAFGIGCGSIVALIVLSIIIAVAISHGPTTNSNPSTNTQPTPTTQPTNQPTDQPTVQPTVIPTETQAQIESDYKASAVSATVTNLDKNGSAGTGQIVHFTATISNFVKDTSGNTAGANVRGTENSGSFAAIQVEFAPGTDITQLNEGDTIEVWGADDGSFSGANAFGGTVQEVAISAAYLFDHTTNYQANA